MWYLEVSWTAEYEFEVKNFKIQYDGPNMAANNTKLFDCCGRVFSNPRVFWVAEYEFEIKNFKIQEEGSDMASKASTMQSRSYWWPLYRGPILRSARERPEIERKFIRFCQVSARGTLILSPRCRRIRQWVRCTRVSPILSIYARSFWLLIRIQLTKKLLPGFITIRNI